MSSFVIEEERGTDTRTIRHHNGYCAVRLPERPHGRPRASSPP